MKTTPSAQDPPHALTAVAHGSVGVVHTQYMHFDEPLPLVSGQTLEAYDLAIETYGTLNANIDLEALHAKRLTLFGVSNKLRNADMKAEGVPPFKAQIALPYTLTPGQAAGTFLAEAKNRRIVGSRFPNGSIVAPADDFSAINSDPMESFVEAPHTGEITGFTRAYIGGKRLYRTQPDTYNQPDQNTGNRHADHGG